MFRAMSTRKGNGLGHGGYEQLIGESTVDDLLSDAKLIRSRTLPTNFFGDLPMNFESEVRTPVKEDAIDKQVKKASKVHPIFSIFEKRGRRKKATAKPEFSRYMQYLKEGGNWDANASKPVIY
ncbi:hypothetical protein L6452_10358 [Arctium lappa]|uniref:Uncharacterized protein n=1 Tax=Arctium lappa TaxID=4217 RepID=A0ACB9DM75_ARCLA|nr:hypothetical protein L6452_10358 [Arctium lappa]